MSTEWHADDVLLARYVRGMAGAALGASVEQHLLACARCRTAMADHVDLPPLEAGWDRVRDRIETPPLPLLPRLLRRAHLAEPDVILLAATSSLRSAWLVGVGVALVFAAAAAYWAGEYGIGLFLLVAPLVPMAGVVAGYGPAADPLHDLSRVAPYPQARRVLLRTGAVLASSLPLAFILGAFLPGPSWLAAAWLLPALAFVVVVLALSTWLDPVVAGTGVALVWALVVGAAALRRVPTALVEPSMQPVYLALGLAALTVLLLRLRNPEALGRIS